MSRKGEADGKYVAKNIISVSTRYTGRAFSALYNKNGSFNSFLSWWVVSSGRINFFFGGGDYFHFIVNTILLVEPLYQCCNGMLRHSLGEAVMFLSLQHFISPSLNLMVCLCVCLIVYCLLALLTWEGGNKGNKHCKPSAAAINLSFLARWQDVFKKKEKV